MNSAEFETTWRPVETEEDKEEIKAVVNQTGKYDPNRFNTEERLLGSRVTEILGKGINALPKDNPVLNTIGSGLGYIAENYTHKDWIKAEESLIDTIGEFAPSIGFDKTFLKLSAGFLIPGGGEMKTVKRTIKSAKLLSTVEGITTSKLSKINELIPGTSKGKINLRKKVLSDEGAEYRRLIEKHDEILKDVNPSLIDGNEVKISPLPEEELILDARKLIIEKERLGIPSPKVTHKEIGGIVKDGHLARITGGQADARLQGKMGKYESTKGFFDRQARENIYSVKDDTHPGLFGDKNNPRRVEARTLSKKLNKERKTIEADHINILETTTPWAITKDSTGKSIWRSREQLDDLTKIMKNKHNIDLGNLNENWIMASEKAHRTGKLSKHVTLGSATDFQKPLVYADADKIQVVLKSGKTKWLTQTGEQLFDGKTLVKKSDIKKKLNLEVNGRQYTPTQKHGASLKLQDTLSSITDTEELADAMKLFMIDSGANDVMAGATTLASYAYDKAKHLDPLTLKLRSENIPSMLRYIDTLLDLPQYANNRVLKDLKRQFTNRMEQYFTDLRQRGS